MTNTPPNHDGFLPLLLWVLSGMLWVKSIPDKTQMLWILEIMLRGVCTERKTRRCFRHGLGAKVISVFKTLSFFPSQLLFLLIPFPNVREKQQNFWMDVNTDIFMQYYSKTVTNIWKHQSQHMIYFNLQNQSYHVQMLGIMIRGHRQPALFLLSPWG